MPSSPEPVPEDSLAALLGTPEMSKDEAMRHAAGLIRDPGVPANQKGPLLSAMARVAGWESAPEWDFEVERGKWMKNFQAMRAAKSVTEGALRAMLEKHKPAVPRLRALVEEMMPK